MIHRTLSILGLLLVPACSADPNVAGDAGVDGGSNPGSDARADSGQPAPDAGGGPPFDGGRCGAPSGAGACSGCVDEKCADLRASCEGVPDCACVSGCLGLNGVDGIPACLNAAGFLDRPPRFGALEECVAVACPDVDECSTPAGWMPPVDVVCPGSAAGIGGGSLADCGFDRGLRFDPLGPILQLENAALRVCARIERRHDGAGSLANTQWTLLSLRVGPEGQVAQIDQAGDGCWYSSHHNFRDWIHAWSGQRHFDLVLKQYGATGARTYSLYVFEQGPLNASACPAAAEGSSCIQGPIELSPVNP
ncbi:MAG: hypothetical protein IT384_10210 [Deltaproteobacteria bacterium]|nr:hypothetical protein [Deltaproteobacteria bacterium]